MLTDLEKAKAAASVLPAGYVIVPVEPTDDALLAAGDPYNGRLDSREHGLALRRQAWRDILAAIKDGK